MSKLIAAVAVAALACPALAQDTEKGGKTLAERVLGKWEYTSGVKAGEKVEKEMLKGIVTITEDVITVPAGEGMEFEIGYKIMDGEPAKIDMDIKEGPAPGKAKGLIQLKGGKLTLCYVPEDAGDRPEKLESTAENKAFLFELRRAGKKGKKDE